MEKVSGGLFNSLQFQTKSNCWFQNEIYLKQLHFVSHI